MFHTVITLIKLYMNLFVHQGACTHLQIWLEFGTEQNASMYEIGTDSIWREFKLIMLKNGQKRCTFKLLFLILRFNFNFNIIEAVTN